MDLTEAQAKTILHNAGVCVPRGLQATSVEQVLAQFETLGSKECVVKAQIRAGGRAQGYFKNDSQSRGGIRFVSSIDQVKASCTQMLNNVLVTDQTGLSGELVQSVYVEEMVKLETEKYLALTIDSNTGSLVFIASNTGGSGIENLAKQTPGAVQRFVVDISNPIPPAELIRFFDFPSDMDSAVLELSNVLLKTLIDKDATLIEINPFGLNKNNELIVLDAAITWDDNALFRQGHAEQMIAYDHLSESEFKATCLGLNYVSLKGNIGTVSAGAGLAMAALDAIHDAGGKPANFLDIPPSSNIDSIRQALALVLLHESIEVLFINIIGGGIMRCDAISDALMLMSEHQEIPVPMVVRLAGINSSLAMQRIKGSMPRAFVTDDLASAITYAVTAANEKEKTQNQDNKSWWHRSDKSPELDVS